MTSYYFVLLAMCLVLASQCKGNLSLPLSSPLEQAAELLGQDSNPAPPSYLITALCWDDNRLLEQCMKNAGLLKRLQFKTLVMLNPEAEYASNSRSSQDMQDAAEDLVNSHLRMPSKREQNRESRFYSNW